jgi:AraC-like DNA-binding protein
MLMFPVPVFVAFVIGYLALRTFLAGGRPLLLALLFMCSVQSLMVALVVFYGIEALCPALPVAATMVPALAWITFRDALFAHERIHDAWPHLSGPAFTLFCTLFAPLTLDIVVPGIFLIYGASLLVFISRAPGMPLARLEAGDYPALIWKALAWALIGSAASDVLIALTYLSGRADWAVVLISISSSLALLFVGLLSVAPDASGPNDEPVGSPQDPAPDKHAAEYPVIVGKLNALLEQQSAHLDPDLTLSRLGRRLHVPEKRLSAAVNRVTGENVSRYVNRWRIRHASNLIAAGTPITEAMLSSGFNTKSNFNREFQRITGVSPSQWRDDEEARAHPDLPDSLPALPQPKRARHTP